MRRHLPHIRFSSYRGISRNAITGYTRLEPGQDTNGDGKEHPDPEPFADARLNQILGPDDDVFAPFPRAFLPKPCYAAEVYAELVEPEKYEIVEVCKQPDLPRNLLGFDVGYWNDEQYSILCDAAIWPKWHAPVREVLDDLARATKDLNEHALFPTRESAERYVEWYETQDWAETTSDYDIIAVGAWDEYSARSQMDTEGCK